MFLPIALIVFVSISSFSEALLSSTGRKQKIDVIGFLTCDGKPASGVLVQLYDTNSKLNLSFFKLLEHSNSNLSSLIFMKFDTWILKIKNSLN